MAGAGTYWVFQRSCAFFTLARAVASVKGGAEDMVAVSTGQS